MFIYFVLLAIASYIVGSIPISHLVAKWYRGIDLRQYGSGQVGGSNFFRTVSKKLTIPIAIFDFGKGALMVWIAQLLGLDTLEQVVVGTAAILGHNWPVFLRFNGGRGIATSMGVVLILMPWGVIVFLCGAIFTLIRMSTPLPVLGGFAAVPLAAFILGEPLALTLGFLALLLIIIVRRLTAPGVPFSRVITSKELFINRFFFDRDVRDAKAWLSRKPRQESGQAKQDKINSR